MAACGRGGNNDVVIQMKTTVGNIKLKLYNETPVHRDNFIKLVNSGYYDGISFHRVIKGFMIQAGDEATRKNASPGEADSLNTYTLPAEINPALFHKRGALAAARQGNDVNPMMRSSGTQFYIVQGIKYTDGELDEMEAKVSSGIRQAQFIKIITEITDSCRKAASPLTAAEIQEMAFLRLYNMPGVTDDFKFTPSQRDEYIKNGGTPFLDGTYTVFGEVIEGLDIVDKIADVKTDNGDRPLNDLRINRMKTVKR
jgi:cyclophilin family peptidyl-prolyl cis-trans isomerase